MSGHCGRCNGTFYTELNDEYVSYRPHEEQNYDGESDEYTTCTGAWGPKELYYEVTQPQPVYCLKTNVFDSYETEMWFNLGFAEFTGQRYFGRMRKSENPKIDYNNQRIDWEEAVNLFKNGMIARVYIHAKKPRWEDCRRPDANQLDSDDEEQAAVKENEEPWGMYYATQAFLFAEWFPKEEEIIRKERKERITRKDPDCKIVKIHECPDQVEENKQKEAQKRKADAENDGIIEDSLQMLDMMEDERKIEEDDKNIEEDYEPKEKKIKTI